MPHKRRPPPALLPPPRRTAGPRRVTASYAKADSSLAAIAVPARPAPREEPPQNPYVDLSRVFTAEGGVLFTYKDLDLRWRHTLRRLALWLLATGAEAWWLANMMPPPVMMDGTEMKMVLMIIMMGINWLIVRKPVQVHRTIEIRPDCMILEGEDVFWVHSMEEIPSFRRNEEGHFVLRGIYGVRETEYLTVRRFDELDKSPEVLAKHLQAAMQTQWSALGRNTG